VTSYGTSQGLHSTGGHRSPRSSVMLQATPRSCCILMLLLRLTVLMRARCFVSPAKPVI
jgi:hypothetical protein